MKSISLGAALIAVFLGLIAVTPGQAEDYFIYHDPDGKLVISNKKSPPGSKIIRQRDLPEVPTRETGKTQPNGHTHESKGK
ncbi:MAG: hypothetical protein WCH75_20595 [Candidatus Binatia bacterium]